MDWFRWGSITFDMVGLGLGVWLGFIEGMEGTGLLKGPCQAESWRIFSSTNIVDRRELTSIHLASHVSRASTFNSLFIRD